MVWSSSVLLPMASLIAFSILVTSAAADVGGDNAVPWFVGRSVSEGNSTTFVLAKQRTYRKDPLNDSNYYTGGWNISDKHYFSSALYTGSPLFLTATIWFLGFGIFLLLVSMYMCCCRRRRYGYSRVAYALSLILLSVFTIAAIVGSIVLYTGQGKFQDSTKSTLNYVVGQADSTVDSLRDVSNYFSSAKNVRVDQVFLTRDVRDGIDDVNSKIASAANELDDETNKNKDNISQYLNAVRLILIVAAAVMLGLALLGFFLSILGLQCLVYLLVLIGWILVALTFILCGVFLVLHNVTSDTCVAMNDWINNPTAHTALDDVIPCVDTNTAQKTLSKSKEVTFQMVQLINDVLSNVSNSKTLPPPDIAPLVSYNQSGPFVPLLCNPYNPDKTDRKCAHDEVDLTNATQIWRNYQCQVSSDNICMSVGRLRPSMYAEMSSAVNVSYGLYHYGPFLTNLVDCTFVRDTFSRIHEDHCPDLERYSRFVFIGLAMVSVAVMLSLIFWVFYARERRHRKYTKFLDSRI